MKHRVFWLSTVPLLSVVLFMSLKSEEISVHVGEATLRSKPTYLSKKVIRIPYATRVKVLERKGAWIKIRYDGAKEAWIHKTATTEEKLELKVAAKNTTVTDREQAIAGKGFNAEVEKEYRKKAEYNYKAVDKMQNSWNVPDKDLEKFAKDGGLVAKEVQGEE
jgi:uncharacterized protein YgiM (DUF1202 family)